MGTKADVRRRWMGAIFLCAAVGLLIAGETVLADRLKTPALLVLWVMAILGFTCLAVAVALLDYLVLQRRTRDEHRALIESTLNEIAREKEAGGRRRPGENSPS